MTGPWIGFFPKKVSRRRDLSDMEFLSIKEFEGKRTDVDAILTLNNTSTETDLATQTASVGKDMYLGEASIGGQVTNIAGGALGGVTYILYANAVEIDRFRIEDPGLDEEWTHKFLTKGKKVGTTQIIKITAKNDNAGVNRTTTHQGKILLFEETTGETPQIPSI